MATIVRLGSSKDIDFKNCDFRRLNITWYIQHTNDNTNFTGQVIDFLKQTVKIVLTRGGKSFTILSCPVYIWLAYSNWLRSNYLGLYNTGTTYYTQLQASGASAKLTLALGGEFILPQFINLRGDDLLKVTINASSGYNSGCDTSASSIYVSQINEKGPEWATPYLNYSTITAGDSTFSAVLGNNITDVLLLNSDQITDQLATQVFENMQLNSNSLSFSLQWSEMQMQRLSQFFNNNSSVTDATLRRQSFMPIMASRNSLQNVQVDLQLNAANVAAAKNFVVAASYYTDERLQSLARSYASSL